MGAVFPESRDIGVYILTFKLHACEGNLFMEVHAEQRFHTELHLAKTKIFRFVSEKQPPHSN